MNHKIPFEYHLKKMMKARSIRDFTDHYRYLVQQNAIQVTFDVQKMVNDNFDLSRKMMVCFDV